MSLKNIGLILSALPLLAFASEKPIKVFILAGDEMVLEQGMIEGRTEGIHEDFYTNAEKTEGEEKKHVTCSVYQGAYSADADYEAMKPVVTGLVELGDQRTKRVHPKKRGRVPVPMAPFPEEALKDGHTTVLRGWLTVKEAGQYEFLPGEGDSAFNLTSLDGKEVYRRGIGEEQASITPVTLEPKKRYPFRTIFYKQPGQAFRLPQIQLPGTLDTVVAKNPEYAFLKDEKGEWITRNDVVLYDAHPIHNNTEAPARPLRVATDVRIGPDAGEMMGVDLMLGHRLGEAYDEPVMILRFGVRHNIWFDRGSRDLSHDFRPPSSGGGADHGGSWDVIHFNFGVWDSVYRDASSKYFSGYNTTSVEDFEKNLRTLVAKMKKTGATLIWGSATPVWEGEEGRRNGDEDAYNKVAEKVMRENGVIINDLNAEVRRQGFPKSDNVHSVGNLAPKVTETVLAAIAQRKNSTKPLPRVLFIGDSITGSYWEGVNKALDGKAYVCKNPGNGEDTWNGLERMDEWLDLDRYLLNGQSYMELTDAVKKALGDELERIYPGDSEPGAELAGLVWFQGIADGKWDSKDASYETNLANLIRDLRKDLGAPGLPVVVGTLAKCGGPMNPNQQKVFDAQMAVGDPEKYPDFAKNVISIDTRPMCRDVSPGGRDPYQGNAASYLEIGKAMGDSMKRLLEAGGKVK
jgi:lysophospholipase L1-like esterase